MSEEYPILEGEAREAADKRVISAMHHHMSQNNVLDINKNMRQLTKILIEAAIAGHEEELRIEREESEKLIPPAKGVIFSPDRKGALASAIACIIVGGDIDDWTAESSAGFLINAFATTADLTEMVTRIDDIFNDDPPGWYCLDKALTALASFDLDGD